MKYKIMKKAAVLLATVLLAVEIPVPVCAVEQTEAEVEEEIETDQENTEETKEETEKEKKDTLDQQMYELPVQSNEVENWPEGPGTYGEAAILMEAQTGAILYAKNINQKEYPASITKVLTALVAYQYGNLVEEVEITKESLACLGSGYASIGMEEGNVITMEQAMHAMLMASSNEVAYALGEAVARQNGEDYAWFLEKMNETAKELGGEQSNFVNANGVFDEEHYTCALDMALIGAELFKHEEFFSICQTPEYRIEETATTKEHVFQQKHEMLLETEDAYYEKAIGGKTGYTTEAKNTLITMADDGNLQLVAVVLNTTSGHVYPDTKALFDYGFENFEKRKTLENACVCLPKEVSLDDLTVQSEDTEEGLRTTYYYDTLPVGSYVSVIEAESLAETEEMEEKPVSKTETNQAGRLVMIVFEILLASIFVAVLVLVILVLCFRKGKKRRRRRKRKK